MSGDRYNENKPKMSLILEAPEALRGLAKVLEYGTNKYSRGNWKKGLKWTEVVDSAMRHLTAFANGEDVDPESGLHHVDHALTNLLFLSQFVHSDVGEDDRVRD